MWTTLRYVTRCFCLIAFNMMLACQAALAMPPAIPPAPCAGPPCASVHDAMWPFGAPRQTGSSSLPVDVAQRSLPQGIVDVGRYIPAGTDWQAADKAMAMLASRYGGNDNKWVFPCYQISVSKTIRFTGQNITLQGCGAASLVEMHGIPALQADGKTQAKNPDGSLKFENTAADLFVFGMEPKGGLTLGFTIEDMRLNRDSDTTGGAGIKIGAGTSVYIERVSVSNFFHNIALLGGVAIHINQVYSNTGAHFSFLREGSADLLVTPYIAPADGTSHSGSGIYINDSEFASSVFVSAGYELEGIDTTQVVNSYFGGQVCQIRIFAARVPGGTNSQTIMFENVYLDGGSLPTTGLCVPVNTNGWNAKTKSFDGSHYGPQQLRFANGTSQSHLRHDIDIEEPATDRIGLFNNNFGNDPGGGSLVVRGNAAQIVGNNFFYAGKATDIVTNVLTFFGNQFTSTTDCIHLKALHGARSLASVANVDDGQCLVAR